jgi:hypothetical protein
MGIAIGAVNERLREARRKTGAGSSRELARALRAQETWDQKIGIEGATFSVPSMPTDGPRRAASKQRKVLIMVGALCTIVLCGAAIFGFAEDHQAVPPNTAGAIASDPMLQDQPIPAREQEASFLYSKVRSEPRDVPWAEQMERVLRDRYARIPLVASGPDDLRILCGSTVCEVAGKFTASATEDVNSTWQEMQGVDMKNDLAAAGLKNVMMGFGPGFIAYWEKT